MAGAPVKGGKGKDDKTKSDVTPMIQGVVFDRSSAVKTQKLQVDRPIGTSVENTVASTFFHRIHGTGIFTYIYRKNQPFMDR